MVAKQHNHRINPLSPCLFLFLFLLAAFCLLVTPQITSGVSTNDQLNDPWSASSIGMEQSRVNQADIVAIHLSRAEYQLKLGAWPEATQNAQSVLAQEPDNVKAHAILGLIAALGGQQDKAEEALTFLANKPATGIYPDLIAAVVAGQKNNVEQAHNHLAKALEQEPDHPVPLYYSGSLALAQGKMTEAEQAFQAALEKSPQFPPALAGLGQVYWAGKQADKAVAAYQKAIAAEPDTLLYRQQLIAIYKATGQKEAENKATRELLYFIPGVKERSLQQMMDLLNRGENDQAIKQADTLQAVYKKFPIGYYIKAMAFINKGEADAARRSLVDLLSAGPRTVKTHHEAGLCYLTLGDLDKAEEQFKLALALEPENGRTFVFLPTIEQLRGHRDRALHGLSVMLAQREPAALVHYLQANNFLAEDKMHQYQQEMGRGVTLVPGLEMNAAGITPPLGDRIELANNRNLMVLYFFNGWYEQAVRKSALVLKTNPADPFALWYNALSRMIQNRYPDAVASLTRLLEGAPDLAAAHMQLGQAYALTGDTTNALAAFKRAAALAPAPAPAYVAMGDISMQTGEDAEAIQSYRKAIELDPKSPLAYPPLALLLADKPDMVGDARRQAEQAMALAPNSPDSLDALGWVHIQLGQIKQGLEILHRTQELSPRVPRVLYHLGVGYYKDNQPEKAKHWLEAALAINHHFRGSDLARDIVQKITAQH